MAQNSDLYDIKLHRILFFDSKEGFLAQNSLDSPNDLRTSMCLNQFSVDQFLEKVDFSQEYLIMNTKS